MPLLHSPLSGVVSTLRGYCQRKGKTSNHCRQFRILQMAAEKSSLPARVFFVARLVPMSLATLILH